MKALITAGADVDERDENENTPLMESVRQSWREPHFMDLLLRFGAKVDA